MKKTTLLVCALACLLVQSALATITVTASPSSQSGFAPGGTFNVSLSLNVTGGTPTDIKSFDVIFEGLATQNGTSLSGFAVTGFTPGTNSSGWQRVFAGGSDAFGSLATDRSGFLQTSDEGASGNGTATTLTSNFNLGTWTFSIPANATVGTYNFDTTFQGTSASHFSDMFASTGGAMAFSNSAPFSIGVAAIPEPATWSLLGLGGLGAFGLNLLRAKRRS